MCEANVQLRVKLQGLKQDLRAAYALGFYHADACDFDRSTRYANWPTKPANAVTRALPYANT